MGLPALAMVMAVMTCACHALGAAPATRPAARPVTPPATAAATRPAAQLAFTDLLAVMADLELTMDREIGKQLRLEPRVAGAVEAAFKKFEMDRALYEGKNVLAVTAVANIFRDFGAAAGPYSADDLARELRPFEPYMRGSHAIQAEGRRSVFKHLTPAQQAKWEGRVVRKQLDQYGLAQATLSDAQRTRLDAVCDEAGTRVLGLGEHRTAQQGIEVVRWAVEQCRTAVLTPAQCKQLGPPWYKPPKDESRARDGA